MRFSKYDNESGQYLYYQAHGKAVVEPVIRRPAFMSYESVIVRMPQNAQALGVGSEAQGVVVTADQVPCLAPCTHREPDNAWAWAFLGGLAGYFVRKGFDVVMKGDAP